MSVDHLTRVDPAWLWKERHVKLGDGFTFTMPDTLANQAAYPQANTQKLGGLIDTTIDRKGCVNAKPRRKLQLIRNLRRGLLEKRRARGSNPQPVTRHHISSVTASHSLTLRGLIDRAHAPLTGSQSAIRRLPIVE